MKSHFLRSNIVNDLYNKVENNLENYRDGDFSKIEKDASLFFEGDFDIKEDLLSKIDGDDKDLREVENCELMFKALPDITPYLARDNRLWVYLTHTLLLEYTRKRWPIPEDDDKAVNFIRLHFFARGARGIERDNAASRLWWMANLCNRVDSLTLKESLTAFLFMTDVRANIIERPTISQSISVFSAIVRMLHNSLKGDQKLFKRKIFRPFMMELNLIGGVKLLDILSKNDINSILKKCEP